ncbi:CRISPR-associated exonuclease Cas4 [Azospirillaceae bacterium]
MSDDFSACSPDEGVSEAVEGVIALSALNHYAYCRRRCALIHIDGVFVENLHTQQGRREHENVDVAADLATADGVRRVTALTVWSDRLGLIGRCDLVEFHSDGAPFPIEFKHSRRRSRLNDDLQLCGQALCLEEMFHQKVEKGAIFHRRSNRRREISFNEKLRALTLKTIQDVRALLAGRILPPPLFDERCDECSLYSVCLPEISGHDSAEHYDIFTPLPDFSGLGS